MSRKLLLPLAILWLAGMGLRLTVLAVPPVIPLIHADLHMSETEIGALGSLPSLLFAFAAVPGSLLIARTGAVPTLIAGLVLTAFASAVRGAADSVATLYLATIAMSAGVAIMQPALPPLVRAWCPDRIGFGTAVYTNGLLIGETLPVALTLPVVLPLVGGWRWSFVVWGVPVLLTGLVVLALAPRDAHPRLGARRHWWPDWKNPLVWRLAFMMGGVNTAYFATNTFLPDYLHATGDGRWISAALTSLNFFQLPVSFAMLALAEKLVRRHAAYIVLAALVLASAAGLAFMPGAWIVVWSGILGGANAAMLVLMLALPPLLARPEDVHRVIAAMFTISYPTAVVFPILAGFAWDASGWPGFAFVPAAIAAVAIIALAPTIDFHRSAA
ncbi:MAG: MFS transporter [Alphaproteobacteria bacterium]|nr:MFS transporter [Alphaproteobacteria bacterium]